MSGQTTRIVSLLRRKLDRVAQIFGENSTEGATALEQLAKRLRQSGEEGEAVQHEARALSIRAKLGRT